MAKRPTISLYEPEGAPAHKQKQVHRPMTAAEHAEWKKDREERLAQLKAGETSLLTQVQALSKKDRAKLKELLS